MKLLCFIKMIVRDIIEDAINQMMEDNEEQRVIYRVIKNLPVVSLFHYVPKSVDDTNDTARQHNRELLWSFKDGKDDEIMWAVLESFTKIIRKLLGNDTHDITLAFIPSDEKTTARRWGRFSSILADILGCDNGYKHLRPTRDSVPRHYIGGRGVPRALDVDEDYFDGKRVVLIDDIINTGRTLSNAIETLQDAGADVVMALSVATT